MKVPLRFVILAKRGIWSSAAECRSLASLGMTVHREALSHISRSPLAPEFRSLRRNGVWLGGLQHLQDHFRCPFGGVYSILAGLLEFSLHGGQSLKHSR